MLQTAHNTMHVILKEKMADEAETKSGQQRRKQEWTAMDPAREDFVRSLCTKDGANVDIVTFREGGRGCSPD